MPSLSSPSGEVIEEDNESDNTKSEDSPECTAYSLRGIVVHSGQDSGGHYYSFIRYRYVSENRGGWGRAGVGRVRMCVEVSRPYLECVLWYVTP